MIKFYSPLRYPGGKNKLAKFISLLCNQNYINGHYVEPYAGGASVALYLLINGCVQEITINDYDRGIYAFWYSILNNNEEFCKKIENTDINIDNWNKFKKIHSNKKDANLFELGFATFFLNRTNRSGIIDGGIIGGRKQEGKYKIDSRFNKSNLIERIRLIEKYKEKIHLYNLDALDLIDNIQKIENKNTIFYFDPPYYLKGPSLYMNHYKKIDHQKVSKKIKNIKNAKWIVSYDNVIEIKKLYKGYRKKEYTFSHVAYKSREGKEVLFFSDNVLVPRIKNPVKVII